VVRWLSCQADDAQAKGVAANGEAADAFTATVMFSDLVGSTALSARMDPEDLCEVLSTYQSVPFRLRSGSGQFGAGPGRVQTGPNLKALPALSTVDNVADADDRLGQSLPIFDS
jgi:hypothetical protein